jgi:hypothetical protein
MRGERYRRIIADQRLGISVLVTFAILSTGCPSVLQPVDTSQTILVEVGAIVSDADAAVAEHMPAAQDRAREAVMVTVRETREERAACIEAGTDPGECVALPTEEQAITMYDTALDSWNTLVASLVAFHGFLQTWEQVNDGWRESGERPPDWGARICTPLGTASTTILDLLVEVGVPVSEAWQAVVGHAETVCRLGVGVAEMVTSSEEGGDE